MQDCGPKGVRAPGQLLPCGWPEYGDEALTENCVLDGALRVVEVHEQLPVQVLNVALVIALAGLVPDTLQPGDQGGGGRQPHLIGNVIQAF